MKKIQLTLTLALALGLGANAQVRDWGCDEATQQEMLEQVSLYQDNMKQFKASKDVRYLEEAYPQWKQIVEKCPKQSKNLYINGANILKNLYAKATTQGRRDTLINELIAMYDARIANYGEAGEVNARKAMDIESLQHEAGLKTYYGFYCEAVKVGGADLDAAYVTKYFEATVNYVKAGFAEPTLIIDNYDIASDLLDKQLEANFADSIKANKIREYISNVEANFAPYASCEQLVEIYTKKFQANPDDLNLMKKITNIMMKKGCTEESLFFEATEKLYAMEPSPETAMRMGQMCVAKKKYSKATEYLQEATKGITETKDLYKAYILLGLAYGGQNSYSAARSAYYKAAEVDPTKGEPYLQIAQLYAGSARSIEDGMNGRSAYWAAVDKAVKAKNVDSSPETVEIANKLIGTYSANYPKKNDAFMLDLIDGQSHHVGGWIGESTIVRTR